MARLVLRVRRGGRLLGSWTLGQQPLEFSIVDLNTGVELGSFTAKGADVVAKSTAGGVDEVPIPAPLRLDGDDFTVPIPEPTGGVSDPGPTEERKAVRNLAREPLLQAGRIAGDDLTMPHPDHTVTTGIPVQSDSADGGGFPNGGFSNGGFSNDPAVAEDTSQMPEVTLGEALSPLELQTEEVQDGQPSLLPERDTVERPAMRAMPPRPRPVQAAEVWVRKSSEWRSAGRLVTGQRVRMLGAWMRLRPDGRLVVNPGSRMAGSGTMVDGRHVEINAGEDAIALPAGASVLLCFQEHGLYVRTEPLAESTDSIAYDVEASSPYP